MAKNSQVRTLTTFLPVGDSSPCTHLHLQPSPAHRAELPHRGDDERSVQSDHAEEKAVALALDTRLAVCGDLCHSTPTLQTQCKGWLCSLRVFPLGLS